MPYVQMYWVKEIVYTEVNKTINYSIWYHGSLLSLWCKKDVSWVVLVRRRLCLKFIFGL